MVLHQVAFRHKNGTVVSMVEWRSRPLNARQAIQLYDTLKKNNITWRLENNSAVESNDPVTSKPVVWAGVVGHFVDGTEFLKEFVW